jgi:hypothetical protein
MNAFTSFQANIYWDRSIKILAVFEFPALFVPFDVNRAHTKYGSCLCTLAVRNTCDTFFRIPNMASFLYGHGVPHTDETGDILEEEIIKDDTRVKILDLTSYPGPAARLEEVLLALLKEQQMLKDKLGQVILDGEAQAAKLSQLEQNVNNDMSKLSGELDKKICEVQVAQDKANDDLNEGFEAEIQDIKQDMEALEIKVNVGQLMEDMEETVKHLEEINEDQNKDLDRLEKDLKMGLEEEKMLRGQDIGLIKFNLNEGIGEMKEALEGHKKNVEKVLEEEREDRQVQNTNILDKIDKEIIIRRSIIAGLKDRIVDEQDELMTKVTDHITEIKEDFATDKKILDEKLGHVNQDMDDMNTSVIERINGTIDELTEAIKENQVKQDQQIGELVLQVKAENEQLKTYFAEENNVMETMVHDEVNSIANLDRKLAKELTDINEKIKNGSKEVLDRINEQKVKQAKLIDDLTDKVDEGFKIVEGNIEETTGQLKSEISLVQIEACNDKDTFRDFLSDKVAVFELRITDETAIVKDLLDIESEERQLESDHLKNMIAEEASALKKDLEDQRSLLRQDFQFLIFNSRNEILDL